MIRYTGVLPDRHVRATARVALESHGAAASVASWADSLAPAWEVGRELRDRVLPALLARFVALDRYRGLADTEPHAWGRLPYMLGLGAEQARVLHACCRTDHGEEVRLLGATFNAAIALLDHVVDDRPVGAGLFERLDDPAVGAIFTDPDGGAAALAEARGQSDDVLEEVVFGLVMSCGAQGCALLSKTGAVEAWRRLGERVATLLAAEREVALVAEGAEIAAERLAEAVKLKSVGPSLVIGDVVALAAGPEQPVPSLLPTAAERIGCVLALADDLADLALDGRQGKPNALLLRRAAGPPSDADLYAAIDAGARELSLLLAAPPGVAADRGPGADDDEGAARSVREFTLGIVAAWLDWPVRRPSLRGIPDAGVSPRSASEALQGAVDALVAEAGEGYGEASHHLRFPRGRPGEIRYETHVATTSFRAVAVDALLDAEAAGLRVPAGLLAAEAMALLRAKHPLVRGGWSYFATVPELPPDADDLGQVLQALTRFGGADLACTCDDPLRLALDATEPSGGFPTWILDPLVPGDLDRRIRDYLEVMGGAGVHPEVVANLLAGLLLYDPARYDRSLERGVAYLESAQQPDGWWESMWYAGPFYGTFKAAAVLGRLAPDGPASTRAREFLSQSQHADGCWGEGDGNPLATAHAILAWACLGESRACDGAADWLLGAQADDGRWEAVPWIQFPTTSGVQTHASRAMTTAFALKACLAAAVRRVTDRREADRVVAWR